MAVAASLWPAAAAATAAQAAVRAEAGVVAGFAATGINPVTLTGRIELQAGEEPGWRSGGFQWHLAANPTWQLTPSAGPRPPHGIWRMSSQSFDWALEEAYLAVRRGGWELSAGQQRLPLEVARLSLPFRVEPVGPGDLRLGLWGVRLVHQWETARLRLAAVDYQGRLTPAASLRWQGRHVVLEAHTLAEGADPVRVTAGLTASGLVRQLVAYGEVWHGLEWYYVGGLSGLWGESLWTVEAGRASPAPGQPVRRLVGAQLAWRQDEEVAWAVTQYVFLDEDSLRGQLALERAWAAGPHEVRLVAAATLGPEAPTWSVGAAYRYFWSAGGM